MSVGLTCINDGIPTIVGSWNVYKIQKDILSSYLEIMKFGDLVKLKTFKGDIFFANHPDYIKHVLQSNQSNYKKGWDYDDLHLVLGNGLITSNGDFWRKQRRKMQPGFCLDEIKKLPEVIKNITLKKLETWEDLDLDDYVFDISREMMHITLQVVVDALFGASVAQDRLNDIDHAWTTLNRSFHERTSSLLKFPLWVPTKKNRIFNSSLRVLNEIVLSIIENQRKIGAQGILLKLLFASIDEATSDIEIRDEVMTQFLAGHETSSVALSWLFYKISQSPVIENKIRDEIKNVVGNRYPTFSDLNDFEYTKMVINEALRLYPPVIGISRCALNDDEIAGHKISRGSIVGMSQYMMHRDPRYYEKPDEFYPEHFLPDKIKERPKFSYFPFGGGSRVCIGNKFALTEILVILIMVYQKYHLELIENQEIVPEPLITLRPKNGIHMRLHKIN